MSTTILARTDQGLVKPLTRVSREVRATPRTPRPARRPSRRERREARRIREYDVTSANLNPRVIDTQIRSVALWPRAYR